MRMALPQGVQAAIDGRKAGGQATVLAGQVRDVIDGDSIVVRLESGPIEVRLSGTDAPEYDQPWGRQAKQALRAKLRRGTRVTLEPVQQDQYDRLVAIVYLGDESLEEWQLRAGHAWAYRKFTSDTRYCAFEHEARAHRRGLWAEDAQQIVAPWDWRRRQRDAWFMPSDRRGETLESCIAALRRDKAAQR